ncbi:ATP-binding protein [Nannocystis sp. ILAH1]|uniref:AlbA family DNA-binding domain-containing protein n=1 Tax=Nannocystis sp. ILAH1 TaxID=2996789 RepID=UPI00226F5D20|nr:ATP-binding protein [Nannocystis sp. ILAH1]MCY0992146.1 ATP-binding protein [Nannocystis sp. ILAH1]
MSEWNQERLQSYIDSQIEESLVLDYKHAKALDKGEENAKRREDVSKDVSAMANSEGGVIIYGIEEDNHLPIRLTWLDRRKVTREALEQLIAGSILPRVSDLRIHTITSKDDPILGAYVVEIPKSHTAHQALDRRYYKRHNFNAEPMADNEVRIAMSRGFRVLLERKLAEGFNFLYAFFLTLAHQYHQDMLPRIQAVLEHEANATLDLTLVEEVAETLTNTLRTEPVFHVANGTLRDLPSGQSFFHVVAASGFTGEAPQIPASLILTTGIEAVKGVCGTALATYGPAMGVDLIEKIDRLHGFLCSTLTTVEALCSNVEYLESTGGRITDAVFLSQMKNLIKSLAVYHTSLPRAELEESGPVVPELARQLVVRFR